MDNLMGEGLQKLFGDAEQMKKRMEEVKQTLQDMRVTGVAGGGAVRVTMSGDRRVLGVEIRDADVSDLPLLEDLITAAVNDALQKAEAAAAKEIQSTLGGALAGL